MKRFWLWSFILLLLAGGCAASFFGWRAVMRSLASSGWPSTNGKIIDSRVEEEKVRRTGSGTNKTPLNQKRYQPKIDYTYSVNDKSFNGTRISYSDHGYLGKSKSVTVIGVTRYSSNANAKASAQKIAKKYHKGKKVTVFYMPDNPGESVLEPGFTYKVFAWPICGIVLLAIGVIIAWLAISVSRDKDREETSPVI
ncbi:MAG: DUF3592 domain-containing protein [Opitutales bacterium]|nr:DUF3592 domain-containing protein [Opitutales bacterium]